MLRRDARSPDRATLRVSAGRGRAFRRVVANRGCFGRGGYDPERDATPIHDRRALDAPFAPVHRAPAGLLTSARGLGDAAVYRQVAQQQADESIVGFKHHLSEVVHNPLLDPLVAPTAQSSSRTPLVGYPPVSAAEHQDLDELLEGNHVGDAGTVTTK